MPGPGPHLIYTLGSGLGLMSLSHGRFSPHHCIVYAVNAFLGPDLGSVSEWLTSTLGIGQRLGSLIMDAIHHPLFYTLILGLPLSVLYSCLSRFSLRKGVLDSLSGLALTRRQCLLLVSAGSLSHFFLDHLFEENGHSSMYSWILSTGWWKTRAPVNPDAVVVVGFLCICLLSGFIYINRVKPAKSITKQSYQSTRLILIIGSLYCLWCANQIYWRNPPQPAVGEEADLGVLVFLAVYFFLPHSLCIMSMNGKRLPRYDRSSCLCNSLPQELETLYARPLHIMLIYSCSSQLGDCLLVRGGMLNKTSSASPGESDLLFSLNVATEAFMYLIIVLHT